MSAMPAPGQGGPVYPRPVAFDPRPLQEPVDRGAVRSFAQQLRAANGLPPSDSRGTIGLVAGIVMAFVMVSFVVSGGSVFVGIAASAGAPSWFVTIAGIMVALFVGAFLAAIITLIVRVSRRGGGGDETRYRLHRFAAANGMSYLPMFRDPGLPGMIFNTGSARHATDLVRGTQPRFVEFGNFRFTTQSGKNSTTHQWGYVAVRLDTPLPHIVLDALGNNGILGSNLPTSFDAAQRLSLEGDFDRYFSLYCPAGYERDALYLFTPDIMARFIDNAAALDVEIVDDWMFLYAKDDFSTLDPARWGWLFSVVRVLLDKLAQWERWRDDRLSEVGSPAMLPSAAPAGSLPPALPFSPPAGVLRPPPGVAVPGRRLRRGIPWVIVIIGGVIALAWILPPIIGFLIALFGGLGSMN